MADLSVTYAGMKLKNPIIGGSGPTYDTVEGCKAAADAGFAGFILKSLAPSSLGPAGYQHAVPRFKTVRRFEPCEKWRPEDGEQNMDVVSTGEVGSVWGEAGYIDYAHRVRKAVGHRSMIGISTFGIEFGIPRSESAQAVYDRHFEILAEILKNGDGDFVELPLSNLCFTSLDIPALIRKAKNMFPVPVTVKLSDPFTFPVNERVKLMQDSGVDGVTLFDATSVLDFDIDTLKLPFRDSWYHFPGGTSLPWVNAMIARCRIAGLTIPITGSFGIWDWPDAVKLIMSGADIVQVCRKVMIRGHKIVGNWLTEIDNWMDDHNYKTVPEMKGKILQLMDYKFRNLKREEPLEKGGVPSLKAVIDAQKCEGCAEWCVPSCNYFALEKKFNQVNVLENRCAGCGTCEGTCPTGAITLQPNQ